MVTGASTADLAVALVDARKGLLTQTRRHTYLVSLLGIREIVLAINKMDLVDYSQQCLESIEREFREFAAQTGRNHVTAIPLSAVEGDASSGALPFRMPVQWVNRPHQDFRGYAGRIASGTIRPGDRARVLPSGRECRVARIVTLEGDLAEATAGQSVTLTLTDQTDVSRGDVLAAADAPPATVSATVAPLKYKLDVNTWQHLPAERLELNEVGVCELELDRAIAFEPYERSRDLGGFILKSRSSWWTPA